MSGTTDPNSPGAEPVELIFKKRYDEMTWGYACPIQEGETPTDAFLRVLNHIIDTLPGFARPPFS